MHPMCCVRLSRGFVKVLSFVSLFKPKMRPAHPACILLLFQRTASTHYYALLEQYSRTEAVVLRASLLATTDHEYHDLPMRMVADEDEDEENEEGEHDDDRWQG